MTNSIKKVVSYLLIGLVLIFSIIAILGIWDIIELEDIARKLVGSLLVVFGASAVVLFIFTVLIKDNN